jgi:hypothetical protein
MFKNRRSGAIAALFAALLGVGLLSASNASAYFIDSPVAAVAAPAVVPMHPVVCINAYDGHHTDRTFWTTVPGHSCPAGHYWASILTADETTTSVDSRIVLTTGSVTSAAGVAGNGSLVISVPGMPPFSATQVRRTFTDVDGEVLSGGVTVAVGTPTSTPGGTTWNYPVTVAGQVAATPAQAVRLDVLAIPVA